VKKKLQDMFVEYGTIALVTYLAIFAVTFAGFAMAIAFGFSVETTAESAGTLFTAWLATKLTQPLRIGAVAVLTPIVAASWHRIRGTGSVAIDCEPPQVVATSEGAAPAQPDEAAPTSEGSSPVSP
jgi:hypothetical protein